MGTAPMARSPRSIEEHEEHEGERGEHRPQDPGPVPAPAHEDDDERVEHESDETTQEQHRPTRAGEFGHADAPGVLPGLPQGLRDSHRRNARTFGDIVDGRRSHTSPWTT